MLVEGNKSEPQLFNKCFRIINGRSKDINPEIISFGTTIYSLFKELMRSFSDNSDNIDIQAIDTINFLKDFFLAKINDLELKQNNFNNQNRKDLIKTFNDYIDILSSRSNKFTDIILIFDFDPHVPCFNEKNLDDLFKIFSDSTNKRGKLYINYPMHESFKCLVNEEGFLSQEEFNLRMWSKSKLRNDRYKKYAAKMNTDSVINLNSTCKIKSKYRLKSMIKMHDMKFKYIKNMSCTNIGICSDEHIVHKEIVSNMNKTGEIYELNTSVRFFLNYIE